MAKYQVGQQVTCNGNPQGRIQSVQDHGYEVSLMDGSRWVGMVSVSERDLDIENEQERPEIAH